MKMEHKGRGTSLHGVDPGRLGGSEGEGMI